MCDLIYQELRTNATLFTIYHVYIKFSSFISSTKVTVCQKKLLRYPARSDYRVFPFSLCMTNALKYVLEHGTNSVLAPSMTNSATVRLH